jgi:hypothetical protein
VGMTYTPRPATRKQCPLRLALAGPSGSGKTFSSLLFASALGDRLCVIDSERGSSELYAGDPDIPPFDVIILEEATPEAYIAAIEAAAGYDVLILDSISPEWTATLEIVDAVTQASASKNAYTTGWAIGTPRHNRFVRTMLSYPGHVIATIRQKTKYVLEDKGSGLMPKKAGWEWIQRDLLEFEFDLCAEIDFDHVLKIVKTRCRTVEGLIVPKPTADVMLPLKAWLGTGTPVHTLQELFATVKTAGYGEADLKLAMARLTPGIEQFRSLRSTHIEVLYDYFTAIPTAAHGSEP